MTDTDAPSDKRGIVDMGFGEVVIASGHCTAEKVPCICYAELPNNQVPRPINTNSNDIYPYGSIVPTENILACIYFHTPESLQQTIDILQQMQSVFFPDYVSTEVTPDITSTYKEQNKIWQLSK